MRGTTRISTKSIIPRRMKNIDVIEQGAKMYDQYRFTLWRTWDHSKQKAVFIGLNPSTANADEDDPTIRRVVRFAYDWGYGGVNMLNLFPLITPFPEELKQDKITEFAYFNNMDWIKTVVTSRNTGIVVCAWGAFNEAKEKAKEVMQIIPQQTHALGVNKDGSPKHPLYIAADTKPIEFSL